MCNELCASSHDALDPSTRRQPSTSSVDHTNTPTTVNEFLPFQSTGLRSQEPLGYDQKCKYCAERRQLANSQQLTGGEAGLQPGFALNTVYHSKSIVQSLTLTSKAINYSTSCVQQMTFVPYVCTAVTLHLSVYFLSSESSGRSWFLLSWIYFF